MNDGTKKHRVYVELAIEIDILDNWDPTETGDLLSLALYDWWKYAKSGDDTMVIWQRDGFVIEEVKNG